MHDAGSTEDFELLERLNKIAATRYGDMALKAGALVDFSKQLQEKVRKSSSLIHLYSP